MDGEVEDNNWWDCDTEARGRGDPDEEDKSPTDPVSASRRTKVLDMFVVGVKDERLAEGRPSDSVGG